MSGGVRPDNAPAEDVEEEEVGADEEFEDAKGDVGGDDDEAEEDEGAIQHVHLHERDDAKPDKPRPDAGEVGYFRGGGGHRGKGNSGFALSFRKSMSDGRSIMSNSRGFLEWKVSKHEGNDGDVWL